LIRFSSFTNVVLLLIDKKSGLIKFELKFLAVCFLLLGPLFEAGNIFDSFTNVEVQQKLSFLQILDGLASFL